MQNRQLNIRNLKIGVLLTVLATSMMLLSACVDGVTSYEATRFNASETFIGNLEQCIGAAVAVCPEVGEVTSDWITQNEPD